MSRRRGNVAPLTESANTVCIAVAAFYSVFCSTLFRTVFSILPYAEWSAAGGVDLKQKKNKWSSHAASLRSFVNRALLLVFTGECGFSAIFLSFFRRTSSVCSWCSFVYFCVYWYLKTDVCCFFFWMLRAYLGIIFQDCYVCLSFQNSVGFGCVCDFKVCCFFFLKDHVDVDATLFLVHPVSTISYILFVYTYTLLTLNNVSSLIESVFYLYL